MPKGTISSGNGFLFLLNIIFGTGIFLNTVPLYFLLKENSFLAYLLTGFLMIPIICVTYLLANENQGASLTELFFRYFGALNKMFVPLYALSKISTTVIGMLFISSLLNNMLFGKIINNFYTILFFFLVYLLCILLVYYDVSINYIIQKLIIFIKLIPLLGIILFFIFYLFYNKSFMQMVLYQNNEIFNGLKLMQGASITIFAFSGFETLFSINHLLGQNKKQGAFLVGISFFCALFLYVLYQFCIGNLANYFIISTSNSLISFASFFGQCFNYFPFSSVFILLINIAIMVSSLGVTHGIMYSVVSNLFASLPHFFSSFQRVKYFVFSLVPFYAILGAYNIFILQQLSSLGTMITYAIFVLCYRKMQNRSIVLLLFSIISMFIFFIAHFYNAFYYFGFMGYIIYSIFFVLILCLNYFVKRI